MPTLIGDGGHAIDIWDTMTSLTPRTHRPRLGEGLYGWRQVAHHDEWDGTDPDVLIAINDSQTRARVAAQLGVHDRSWFHPNAYLGPDCDFGHGVHINYGVTMTRTRFGNHVTVAPGVTICGDVTIGDRVFIGAGAIIINLTTVPDDTFIKAGTVWTQR